MSGKQFVKPDERGAEAFPVNAADEAALKAQGFVEEEPAKSDKKSKPAE